MNSFKMKIIALFLLNAVSLVISDQLETDRVSEERDKIFSDHGCKEGECEIIEIELPRRHKRSADSTINLPIKAFGRQINLNLRQFDNDALFGPNTPVYFAQSSTNIQKQLFGEFSSQMRSKLYEDEQHLAAFTLDNSEDGSFQIKSGYIGSENLKIERLDRYSSNSQLRQSYLAKSLLGDLITDTVNFVGDTVGSYLGYQYPSRPEIPIPNIIYPKILIIVDYALSQQYGDSSLPHVVEFWHQVNMIYRQIKNPEYRLNIAGIVVPQGKQVFSFLNSRMNYKSALKKMTSWLQEASNSIPYSSYDVHMAMTPHHDYDFGFQTSTAGLTSTPSACFGILYGLPSGGIISDRRNEGQNHLVAAHELGHALGANHDIWSDPSNLIMASAASPYSRKAWSRRSIQELHNTLKVRDFSCMYNKPDVGHNNEYPPAGNGYSEPTDKNDDESSDSNGDKPRDHKPYISINDDEILVFDLSEFEPDKKIGVFYMAKALVIIQSEKEKVPKSWSRNQEKSDLQMRVPDTEITMLNPATINPSKPIHFAHDKGYIYIYQMADTSSSENAESTRDELYPTNKLDLDISAEITNKIFVKRSDFNLNKMVNVFVYNQKLYVSQSNAPKNDDLKLTAFTKIQYCQNANQPITFNPLLLNPDKEFEIVCEGNIICIVEQPDTYTRFSEDDFEHLMHEVNNETFGTETATRMPVPDMLWTTPKSDLKSPVTDFNITVESEVLVAIFPYEFNLDKLVLISFENGRLKITQIGAPEEMNPNLLDGLDILHTVTSDKNKLLLHPARIPSQDEIKMIHRNNDIYIWTKSNQEPDINVDNPDLVQVIGPKIDFNNTPDVNVGMSGEIGKGNEFNPGETRPQQPVPDNRSSEPHDRIMPPPVTLGITPKSDLKSPVTDFNIAVESEVMLAIFPYEFNLNKLVLISFENGRLKVTQIGAPKETNPNLLDGLDILHTVTSDKNKLLLHPARIPSQDEIKMIHRNNDIYIWTKSDQEPDINVDNPNLIQVIGPKMYFNNTPDINVSMSDDESNPGETRPQQPVPDNRSSESHDEVTFKPDHEQPKSDHKSSENNSTIEDFSKSVDDLLPVVLTSNKFNPNKLVVISHKNHKINVYQVERNGNNADLNAGYVDLHYSFSDKTTLTFDPLMIDPKKIIVINYIDNKTHVNSAQL